MYAYNNIIRKFSRQIELFFVTSKFDENLMINKKLYYKNSAGDMGQLYK